MSTEERVESFMQKVLRRPLPNDPVARLRVLARELAEGAFEKIWEPYIALVPLEGIDETTGHRKTTWIAGEAWKRYFDERWGDDYPDLLLLQRAGYLDQHYGLTQKAIALMEEAEPATIFISYRRRDSSAFALLVLKSLKEAGLNAFLDMTIQPGDDWHAYIREQIEAHDFFILLLGKHTLNSDVVRDEITWAIESKATILPIWHNGFVYSPEEGANLPTEINHVLQNTHTIRVLEESALAYNNAIVELLNRFGITP